MSRYTVEGSAVDVGVRRPGAEVAEDGAVLRALSHASAVGTSG